MLQFDPVAADAREQFADAVRKLDEALLKSAAATHGALQQLALRGKDYTDNDLKEALLSLKKLEEDYVATTKTVADEMSGNMRREMLGLAAHAQNLGVEASARIATMMREFANSMPSGSAPQRRWARPNSQFSPRLSNCIISRSSAS